MKWSKEAKRFKAFIATCGSRYFFPYRFALNYDHSQQYTEYTVIRYFSILQGMLPQSPCWNAEFSESRHVCSDLQNTTSTDQYRLQILTFSRRHARNTSIQWSAGLSKLCNSMMNIRQIKCDLIQLKDKKRWGGV